MLESGASTIQPLIEQQRAVDLFLAGGNLRIDAYAGTGKTTTLRLLAASKPGRALYLAFNRAIARRGATAVSTVCKVRRNALRRVSWGAQDPWLSGMEADRGAYIRSDPRILPTAAHNLLPLRSRT